MIGEDFRHAIQTERSSLVKIVAVVVIPTVKYD